MQKNVCKLTGMIWGRGELHESEVRRKMGGQKAFRENGIQTMMRVSTFDSSGNNYSILMKENSKYVCGFCWFQILNDSIYKHSHKNILFIKYFFYILVCSKLAIYLLYTHKPMKIVKISCLFSIVLIARSIIVRQLLSHGCL